MRRIGRLDFLFTVIGVAGALACGNPAHAQNFLSSSGIVDDRQTNGSTNAPVNESYSNAWSSGTAFALSDYGANHAMASVTLSGLPPVGPPSQPPFVYSEGLSTYSDTFQFALNHNLVAPSTIVSSAQFIIQVDGTLTLPNGFKSNSDVMVTSANAGDGLFSASTTDVGAALTETSTQDSWAINNSVAGATYTTQSYAITGGIDQVTVELDARVQDVLTNLQFGTATADFSNTGIFKGVIVYDQFGDVIPNSAVTITSASGTQYSSTATPEPASMAYFSAVAAVFVLKRARRRHK